MELYNQNDIQIVRHGDEVTILQKLHGGVITATSDLACDHVEEAINLLRNTKRQKVTKRAKKATIIASTDHLSLYFSASKGGRQQYRLLPTSGDAVSVTTLNDWEGLLKALIAVECTLKQSKTD